MTLRIGPHRRGGSSRAVRARSVRRSARPAAGGQEPRRRPDGGLRGVAARARLRGGDAASRIAARSRGRGATRDPDRGRGRRGAERRTTITSGARWSRRRGSARKAEGGEILSTESGPRCSAGRGARWSWSRSATLELKGLDEPVETYRVRWAPIDRSERRPPLPARRLASSVSANFVGRAAEVEQLAAAWKAIGAARASSG